MKSKTRSRVVKVITDAKIIQFDPMADESVIGFKVVKMVNVRKRHVCFASYNPDNKPPQHFIEAGQRARYEKAIVDGSWHISYHCVPCMGKMIRGEL